MNRIVQSSKFKVQNWERLLILVVFTFHFPLFTVIWGGTATTAANFLRENLSSRQVGMGGVSTAVTDDSYAIQSNPSGLSLINYPEVNLSYAFTQDYSRYGFFAYAHPISTNPSLRFSIGTGILYYSAGNIDVNYADGTTQSFKAETSYAGSISFGARFQKWFAVGASAKYVRSTLVEQFTAATLAGDFGIMLFPLPNLLKEALILGVATQNVGPKIAYKSVQHELPRTDSVGAAIRFWNHPEYGSVLGAVQAERVLGEKLRYRLGGEYALGDQESQRLFFVRGGYRLHFDSEDYSIGFGFREKNLQLDYAFVNSTELEKTHRFTLLFRFGKFKEKKSSTDFEMINPVEETEKLEKSSIKEKSKEDEYYLLESEEKNK